MKIEIEIIKEVAGLKIGAKKSVKKSLALDLINRGVAQEVGANKPKRATKPKATKKPCEECDDKKPCKGCEESAETTNIPTRKK